MLYSFSVILLFNGFNKTVYRRIEKCRENVLPSVEAKKLAAKASWGVLDRQFVPSLSCLCAITYST